jgi:hypothetical protein
MKMKNLLFTILSTTMLFSCSLFNEKIAIKEIKGYVFETNPKDYYGTSEISGLGYPDTKKGDKISDTDFMVVTNDSDFQNMNKCLENNYDLKTKLPKIDFKKSFVFIVLHPRPTLSGGKYLDEIVAEVDSVHNLQITTSVTACSYTEVSISYDTGLTYAPYQVSLYQIPKKDFKKVTVLLEDSDNESLNFFLK